MARRCARRSPQAGGGAHPGRNRGAHPGVSLNYTFRMVGVIGA